MLPMTSISVLMPNDPQHGDTIVFFQMALLDAQRGRQRQRDRAGVAQVLDGRKVGRQRQAEGFKHELAVRDADLMANRLIDLLHGPTDLGQQFLKAEAGGRTSFMSVSDSVCRRTHPTAAACRVRSRTGRETACRHVRRPAGGCPCGQLAIPVTAAPGRW
jgi:hypothetical protein